MDYLMEAQAEGQIVTGLLYLDRNPKDVHAAMQTVETPLNRLTETELCPGSATLEKLNASLR
jgi:2-oxoglutarate ferredoxin oxidoreductase subunit beta